MFLLEAERRSRGWSQAEVARRSGVHSTTVSLIESGRFRPGAVQLEKLGRVFGIREPHRLLESVGEAASKGGGR